MCKVLVLLLFLFCGFEHPLGEKRLILHSELDIAQEFARVNKRIDDQAQHVDNLTKTVAEKDKEIANVNKRIDDQAQHIENLTKIVAEKDKEIANVNVKLGDLTRSVAEKDQKVEALKQALITRKETGSTYVRWGRTTCPSNDTELVYHGYMASAAYSTSGGGSNFLCLSPDPQWSYYDESITSGATIKGVEYEFSAHNADGAAKFFGHNIYNDDAVCAVCHSRRSSSLMISGRTDCYSGWTKEYSGYLVSEYDGATHESDVVCLDDRPESVVGGKNNDDEALLYFVEASCGKSLECPPYIHGRELTCVVCSK